MLAVASIRSTLPMLRSASMSMVISSGKPANELQCTVALVKNIVGSGVLTLPAGISQLSDRGSSSDDVLSLSLVLLVVFGFLNGLGFLLIGEACAATNEGSYVGAWRSSVGKGTAWVPALCSLCLTFLATVGCATVIGDVGTDLVAGFTGATFDDLNRNSVLAGFATTCLLPLCLLPSLAPLGSASVLGVVGLFFTCGAMALRYFDGSYLPEAGAFAADVVRSPAFHEAATSPHLSEVQPSAGALFFFLSLVSNAYLAHYNAPGVFNECRRAEQDRREKKATPAPLRDSGAKRAFTRPEARQQLDMRPRGAAEAAKDDVAEEESIFVRLTSRLAAEEVNELFENYIESVPAFDRSLADSFEQGFDEGYSAGYLRGFEDGAAAAKRYEVVSSTEAYGALGQAELPAELPPEGEATGEATPGYASVGDPVGDLPGVAAFRRVVLAGFAISTVLFLIIAAFGFATFGDASEPIILNNYASKDPLAQFSRIGIFLAVLFEFPLLERPFRLTALELLLPLPQFTGAITSVANSPIAAIGSVALITGVSAAGLPLDTGSALAGATGGALLIYVGPALMGLKLRDSDAKADEQPTSGDGGEAAQVAAPPLDAAVLGLYTMLITGVLCALVGTVDTVGRLV